MKYLLFHLLFQDYSFEYSGSLSWDQIMPFLIAGCIVGLIELIAVWKVFTKAGKPGWGVLIPIYNTYLMLKIGGKSGWWLLLFLIPLVNLIFAIWMINMISKSFGKDEGFTVGLLLLGFIFWPILGFGKAKYQGPYGDKAAYAAYRAQHGFEFENKGTTPPPPVV